MTPNLVARRRHLWRWVNRVWFLFAITANSFVALAVAEPGTLAWWVAVTCVAALLLVQMLARRARRRWDEVEDALRWDFAAATPDPVSALAQMDYLDRLSREQREELHAWLRNPPMLEGSLEDLPPVVRGLIEVAAMPPREERG